MVFLVKIAFAEGKIKPLIYFTNPSLTTLCLFLLFTTFDLLHLPL